MHNLIYDVSNTILVPWSCDIDKMSVYDKIVIENNEKEKR